MARHSNKQVAKISSSLPSNNNKQKDYSPLTEAESDRKITLTTEGFTTNKFCELILRDRSRLSKENALIICDYVIAMKREINLKLNTIRTTIQFLSELSRSVGIEKRFEDMTRDDVLLYLDSNRKLENDDPLHKWIGSYNVKTYDFV
jgi:uncharacterized protein YihD (DUF1040 family)